MCEYYTPNDEEFSNKLYEEFGINAAHSVLPHHTKVEVNYKNKTLLVTINDLHNSFNSSAAILQLSKEAAKILDVEKEGLVPCKITIPVIENNWYLKGLMYLLPYISVMFLLRFI